MPYDRANRDRSYTMATLPLSDASPIADIAIQSQTSSLLSQNMTLDTMGKFSSHLIGADLQVEGYLPCLNED